MQTLSVKCNTNGIHMKQEHFSHTAHIQHVTYIVVHALYEQNVRIYTKVIVIKYMTIYHDKHCIPSHQLLRLINILYIPNIRIQYKECMYC